MVTSWERDLSYPQELKPFISTTNALERFTKEVQRRSKVLSPSPSQRLRKRCSLLLQSR
ncbi:hypothetical protein [Candidatus Caldatribacterium saccharofermentans]|uniref:hypothetical protein n=1 Tax=Candidatus Caldatribacterium saccharofermentans TaxID=1454753 RepID=UPI003CFFB5D2